ncbi:hypothetical protein SAMN04487866_10833 [Thermoactinomyces sp. DSM 45891]|uniref:hypothetical protein n=1 Tax=Thermoactinomyces sp. DSM 45891 TaxID=1761907 RepID=UPI000912032F|nr:hypothetical protein [Thermoactinomyces sp. DSM 45891]SFX44697.1 hypothetical protein SAMN04487866_10833 [Thermoactinomyces sp. DSM 45891]
MKSPTFLLGTIRIGVMEGASSVNMGNNWLSDFESVKKHNQGLGSFHGDQNQIHDLYSVLQDSDLIDTFTQAADSKEIPDWLQKLITEKMKPDENEQNGSPSSTT